MPKLLNQALDIISHLTEQEHIAVLIFQEVETLRKKQAPIQI